MSTEQIAQARAALIDEVAGKATGLALARISGTMLAQENRNGPLWAPNREPNSAILACALEKLIVFEDIRAMADAEISAVESEGDFEVPGMPAFIPADRVAKRLPQSSADLGVYFALVCAGYKDADARKLAGI